MNIPKKSREAFSKQLLDDFKSEITGEKIFRVVNANPEDKFFVGQLLSFDNNADVNNVTSSKTFIESVGLDFYVDESQLESAVLRIFPQGDFYYRVYPTLEEQREMLLKEINKREGQSFSSFEAFLLEYNKNPKYFSEYNVKLTPVYKKIQLQKNDFFIEIPLNKCLNEGQDYGVIDETSEYNQMLTEYIDLICENILAEDEDVYRYEVKEPTSVKHLIDNETYESYIVSSRKKDVTINQNWKVIIKLYVKRIKNKILVNVSLVNNSSLASNKQAKKSDNKITVETLFNSGLKVKLLNADFLPIVLDYFLDDYKYDRCQEAVGNNCSVYFEKEENEIRTEHIPVFVQKRLITTNRIDANFTDLINNPIRTLKNILNEMQKEYNVWVKYKDEKLLEISEVAAEHLKSEVKEFKAEIERFAYGIHVLENYPILLKSFIHMNETFKNTSKKYSSWRLFQIVFIVTMIPDIAACDKYVLPPDEVERKTHLEDMALLYFPTGGGKTEAFLGVLVFNLFFDRYRGKKCGVTSILRYPLRLLSVQQVQRLANALAQAELIRRNDAEISDSAEFSLGYFVGDGNTPNSLKPDDYQKYRSMTQEQLDETRVIDICPYCGKKSVHIKVDEERARLIHYCSTENCQSNVELPLYIVDTEIYRYLPSAIISTVDKLAILGNNKNFRAILNGANRKCPMHGYTSSKRCVEYGCAVEADKFSDVKMYDPAPSLFIQDELHLIRESLGTYASHYESFVDYFMKELSVSKRSAKIIGATATISSYQNQVSHLYNKNAIKFPATSPFLDHNFYSEIDENDVQRLIMGYAPYGRAIINSVAYSLKYMRIVVNKYLEKPELILQVPEIGVSTIEEALEILKDYWIFLEYNNVKRDGNNVEGALDTPINVELREEGVTPFITRKMTGDESFQDVREVLSDIENSNNVFEGVNLIVSTSMISHGVDADRFNIMFFYGLPGNTAEYIQAYSRTGRKHSSIVIDIIRPSRETDQSYLKNFNKFHDYKDIMVDAVPINRWATKAIKATIAGIFMGLLLNVYDPELEYTVGSLFMMKNIKKAIQMNLLKKEEIIEHLYRSYGCISGQVDEDLGNQYKIIINDFVNDIFEKIQDLMWTEANIFDGFKTLGIRIMNSLRDTDTQLIVELD